MMSPRKSMSGRRGCLRFLTLLLGFGAAGLLVCLISAPGLGRFLIVQDPLVRADVILVLSSARIERTFEAGVLYREGWGRGIVLSPNDSPSSRRLMKRLGVNVPMFSDIQRTALLQMGVPPEHIFSLPGFPASTEEEAKLTTAYARQHRLSTILVVTSPYHTRRARRYFSSAQTPQIRYVIRPSRFDDRNPERWWSRPSDRIDVILEYAKFPKAWLSSATTILDKNRDSRTRR